MRADGESKMQIIFSNCYVVNNCFLITFKMSST